MELELVQLIVVNMPNYVGFILLAYQQSRMIDALLRIVTEQEKQNSD